jgi:protein transport protein SEC61 subunit alpha
MGDIRFINLIKPLMFLIPEVAKPKVEIKKEQKFVWTAIILFIFLICSQIPLYGIYKSEGTDPLHWMRVILASNRGTLMELGISPLVTSSMIMQVLVGTKIIEVNQAIPEDRELFEASTKLFGILITFGEAVAYVLSGMYGDISVIGTFNCFLLIFQLVFAGILVMVLDELLSKGYGLGSGISLFIATNIAENIVWKAFSPFTVSSDKGVDYEGAFIATVHYLITSKNKVSALHKAFYRANIPNLSNFVATLIVFFVVIYFQGFRYEIKIAHKKFKGAFHTQPIKLFYCSNTPIILQSALVSNLYFISQILYKKYKNFFIIRLIGTWQDQDNGHSIPTGGIAYYISPPNSFVDFLRDPLHTLFYVSFVLISCALFSKTWIELSGKGSRDIARQLRENDYYLEGFRENEENIVEQLNRYVGAAAGIGGMSIGLLTIFADFMGAIGSGTGILLAVTIIYEYFEDMKKEDNKKRFG